MSELEITSVDSAAQRLYLRRKLGGIVCRFVDLNMDATEGTMSGFFDNAVARRLLSYLRGPARREPFKVIEGNGLAMECGPLINSLDGMPSGQYYFDMEEADVGNYTLLAMSPEDQERLVDFLAPLGASAPKSVADTPVFGL